MFINKIDPSGKSNILNIIHFIKKQVQVLQEAEYKLLMIKTD